MFEYFIPGWYSFVCWLVDGSKADTGQRTTSGVCSPSPLDSGEQIQVFRLAKESLFSTHFGFVTESFAPFLVLEAQ